MTVCRNRVAQNIVIGAEMRGSDFRSLHDKGKGGPPSEASVPQAFNHSRDS